MESLTFLASVDADPRPTCVIDLDCVAESAVTGTNTACAIAHSNEALKSQAHLRNDILEDDDTILRAWAIDRASTKPLITSRGHTVCAYTIENRWKVVQWIALEQTNATLISDRDGANERLECLLKMMEMVDVGIFEYDKKGKLVYGNDAFYNLSGHPRDSAKEEVTWQDSIFPEDGDWLMGQWIQLTEGVSLTFEMRWKRPASSMPNGEEDVEGSWVLAACVPTTDDKGEITSVSGCLTDISAQKRNHWDAMKRAEALERAAASEKRFSNFAENLNVAVWILNLNMEVSRWNWAKFFSSH